MPACNSRICPSAVLLTGAALLVPLLGGCDSNDRLRVYPVRGRVVYQDQGLADSTVVFHPADDSSEASAKNLHPFAETDSDGRFELKTYITGDGAPAGEYEVIVIAPSRSGPAPVSREDPNALDEEAQATSGNRISQSLRQKYADAKTSGITVTVKPGENELKAFVLE